MGLMQQMFSGIPTTAGAPTPPYTSDSLFNYVSLLLSGNAETGTSTVTSDASSNNSRLLPVGAVHNDNFSPFAGTGYYGVQFNGTTDYLTSPSVGNLSASTDWTIETWVNPPTTGSTSALTWFSTGVSDDWSTAHAFTLFLGSTNFPFMGYTNNTGTSVSLGGSTVGATTGVWNHIAVCYTGATKTIKVFVNGTIGINTTIPTFTGRNGCRITISRADPVATVSPYYFGGYQSNFRFVNGTAIYTNNFTVPTSPLTAVANTSLLVCQSTRFVDNSANNYTLTIGGTPKISYNQPISGAGKALTDSVILPSTYSSGYFNGTTDYIIAPTAPTAGTGQFTYEAWIYKTTSTFNTIFSYGGGSGNLRWFTSSATTLSLWNGATQENVATVSNMLNAWHHVVLQRDASNVVTIYFDGVAVSTATRTDDYNTGTLNIGAEAGGGNKFAGYISNARFVKGAAVYSGNFTPPAAPLTAISNTVLLTLQQPVPSTNNGIQDSSLLDAPMTLVGTPTQGTFTQFSQTGWSGQFSGGSNYITTVSNITLGTSPFTVEWWFYPTSTPSSVEFFTSSLNMLIMYNGTVSWGRTNQGTWSGATLSTTLPNMNQWNHMAVVREGTGANQEKIYLNGNLVATGTNSSNYAATTFSTGKNAVGNISNLRVTTSAVYTSNFTPSTTPLTAISGTVLLALQSNKFADISSSANSFAMTGTPKIQAISPFNPTTAYSPATIGGSVYFNGTADYITAPNNSLYNFGTGDFTVEFWMYPTNWGSNGCGIAGQKVDDNSAGWVMYNNTSMGSTKLTTRIGGSGTVSDFVSTATVDNNVWQHWALVRQSGVCYYYKNGVLSNSAAMTRNVTDSTGVMTIGHTQTWFGNTKFAGYISDLRITKGVAVYTSSFTPPTAPLQPTSASTLLLNGRNIGVVDSASKNNAVTAVTSGISTSQKKYGTSSMYFAAGDYIKFPLNSASLDFSSGDFTIEAWVYPTTSTGTRAILSGQSNLSTAAGSSFICYLSATATSDVYIGASVYSIQSPNPAANQWSHVAWVRSNNVWRSFLNGVQVGAMSLPAGSALNVGSTTYAASIGAFSNGGSPYTGYIDDLRVTKGVARYTGTSFTPPTSSFPVQ